MQSQPVALVIERSGFWVRCHLAALVVLLAMPAGAATITGGFSMAGSLAPGQDFSGPGTVDVAPQMMVVLPGTVVGDFSAYLAPFDEGTHADISYAPFTPSPVADLWAVEGSLQPGLFAFRLETLSVDFQSATQLSLSGTGLLTHPDFDDTTFDWVSSFQSLSQTGSFSASVQVVPEPSTGSMLALGLVGVAIWRRRGSASRQ